MSPVLVTVLYSADTSLARQAGRAVLPLIGAVLVALLLLLRLGSGVYGLMAPIQEASSAVSGSVGKDSGVQVNLAKLQALDLFGPARSATSDRQPEALPQRASSLNLQLEGVMLASTAQNSRAIIVSQGQQGSFKPGDNLPGASQVKLLRVAENHVVISNAGIEETVWLAGAVAATGAGQASSGAQVAVPGRANSGSAAPAHSAPAARFTAAMGNAGSAAQIASARASLSEIMEIYPAQENGHLIGYRISPGERLKEFVQLGFHNGDIVTEVNGIALNEMANLPRLYSLMNEATDVSFSLLREGQLQQLQIALLPPTP